jgi:hypothetical protein
MLPVTERRPPVVVIGQIARDLVLVVDEVPGAGRWRYLESVPEPALLTRSDVRSAAALMSRAGTVVQLQPPVAAILNALEHLPLGARVIMDGVPEEKQTRDRILAAAAGLTVGHPGGRPAPTAARVAELATVLAGSRG